jgi:hypothetical protein
VDLGLDVEQKPRHIEETGFQRKVKILIIIEKTKHMPQGEKEKLKKPKEETENNTKPIMEPLLEK